MTETNDETKQQQSIHQIHLLSQIDDITRQLHHLQSIQNQPPPPPSSPLKQNLENDLENNIHPEQMNPEKINLLPSLQELQQNLQTLSLAHDYLTLSSTSNDLFLTNNYELQKLIHSQRSLGHVLLYHPPSPLHSSLYQRYNDLYDYTKSYGILELRSFLKQSHYPTTTGCQALGEVLFNVCREIKENKSSDGIGGILRDMVELQVLHDLLHEKSNHEWEKEQKTYRVLVLDELVRPLVERVRFHFLPTQDQNEEGLSQKLDKLPQYLFAYLRDVLQPKEMESGGMALYDLFQNCISPFLHLATRSMCDELSISPPSFCGEKQQRLNAPLEYQQALPYFVREVVYLCRYMFRTRKFFSSYKHNAIVMCATVEQLMCFDSYLHSLIRKDVIIGVPKLMDVFVTSNATLFQQWLKMEYNYAASLLESASSVTQDDGECNIHPTFLSTSFMSPTSEVFVATIQSLRAKMKTTSNPSCQKEFIAKVMVPLCTSYMDALHETASSLRTILIAKRRVGSTTIPSDVDLQKNVVGWMEVIAGTHAAAVALFQEKEENDLHRVARSFTRLCNAMVDECTSSIVETILMERAKLAGYLMRCPFVLSSYDGHFGSSGGEGEEEEGGIIISPDFIESIQLVGIVVRLCDDVSEQMKVGMDDTVEKETDMYQGQQQHPHPHVLNLIQVGPQAIKSSLAKRLEEKMLEVALDVQGMTPEFGWRGAQQFHFDCMELASLFGVSTTATISSNGGGGGVKRSCLKEKDYFGCLLDAASLMAMKPEKFASLKEVLYKLVHPDGDMTTMAKEDDDNLQRQGLILHYDDFHADGTIMNEAQSMLLAKGLVYLDLDDAISIMNRRGL